MFTQPPIPSPKSLFLFFLGLAPEGAGLFMDISFNTLSFCYSTHQNLRFQRLYKTSESSETESECSAGCSDCLVCSKIVCTRQVMSNRRQQRILTVIP